MNLTSLPPPPLLPPPLPPRVRECQARHSSSYWPSYRRLLCGRARYDCPGEETFNSSRSSCGCGGERGQKGRMWSRWNYMSKEAERDAEEKEIWLWFLCGVVVRNVGLRQKGRMWFRGIYLLREAERDGEEVIMLRRKRCDWRTWQEKDGVFNLCVKGGWEEWCRGGDAEVKEVWLWCGWGMAVRNVDLRLKRRMWFSGNSSVKGWEEGWWGGDAKVKEVWLWWGWNVAVRNVDLRKKREGYGAWNLSVKRCWKGCWWKDAGEKEVWLYCVWDVAVGNVGLREKGKDVSP